MVYVKDNIKDNLEDPLAITTSQLLRRLNISRSSLNKLIKDKTLTPIKLFRRNRLFAYSDILKILEGKK